MHTQWLCSLTGLLTLSFTFLSAPVAGSIFHRGVGNPAYHHKRIARHANTTSSNASAGDDGHSGTGALHGGDGAVEIMKRLDDPSELVKRDGTKYIFMHHIVGNTFPYTIQDWKNDISDIQAKGVDALALNIGSSDWQRTQVRSAYAAALALGTGFKLFISFDLTEMPCSIPDVVARVNEHASHANQFLVNGKPMISSYSGDCFGNSGWASIKSQTNGYLMPFVWGLEGNFNSWGSFDSWYCWGCAWPQGNFDKNADDDNFYLSQLGAKYATTISPWFYTHYDYKNRVLRSDNWLLNSRWEQLIAMRNQLTFVEMVTWNDFGESDYFGPIRGAQPTGTTWADGFSHMAWLDMSEYYIKAFKTGVYPAITQDVIYYWARPHAASGTASADSVGRPDGSSWTQDYLWAAVFASGSCIVTLTSGSNSQDFSLQSGVSKIKLSLSVGNISVKMVKGGQTVINKTPTDFTFVTNPKTYNYNAYVGSASGTGGAAPGTSSTSSTTTTSTSTTPAATPSSTAWTYVGCYIDPNSPRVLNGFSNSLTTQTVESCLTTCQQKGFAYGGTEYGKECWCGASIAAGSSPANANDCSMPCAGKSTDTCGGGNRISLYKLSASSGTSSTTSPTSTTTSTTSSSAPTSTATGWSYVGCYNDPNSPRVLNGLSSSSNTQTIASCLASCASNGFAYGGTEYGKECWCGSSIATGSSQAPAGDCSMPCAGKSTDVCGGGNRLSLYRASSTPGSTLPGGWSSAGCYTDSPTRILRSAFKDESGMTTEKCIGICAAGGWSIAGTEYSTQCLCGSALFKDNGAGVPASAGNCNMACSGNSVQMCGGSYRTNLYTASNAPALQKRRASWRPF